MPDLSQIAKHMEVVGSDGQHVGTVDHVALLLTKSDPAAQGQHHVIKAELVGSMQDGKVTLTVPASEAMQQEKAVQD